VGGGNINCVIPSELYRKTTTYFLAKMLGKPVFVSGQTMGPYYGRFAKFYTRRALNTVRMISFRDKETSERRLHDIGVRQPVMFDAADDAITLTGIRPDQARVLIERELGMTMDELDDSLLIMMNMKASLSLFKGKKRNSGLDQEIELMARIADGLIERYQCRIVFMPTDFSGTVDDRVPHRKILERMNHPESAFLIEGTYVDDELIGMIGLADLAIGARYHFLVFAASRHVPFLGLASGVYQRTKLEGLSRLCECEECYIDHDMEFAEIEKIWPQIEWIVDNKDAIRERLGQQVPLLKEQSYRIIDEVADYLVSEAR
jgi:polysaccharide pyruvyl transferase WcaK-like protein